MRMEKNKTTQFKNDFFNSLEKQISEFSANPIDAFASGNVAVCVIDEDGNVFGKKHRANNGIYA